MASILVVDDEPSYCKHLRRRLTEESYKVYATNDFYSAVELASRYQPDLLISDWMLASRHTGMDLSRAVRSICSDTQTILITAYPSSDLSREAEESGIVKIIEKPFEFNEILEAINLAFSIKEHSSSVNSSIGVMNIDSIGRITTLNSSARLLIQEALGIDHLAHIKFLVGTDFSEILKIAEKQWTWIDVQNSKHSGWLLRTKKNRTSTGWIALLSLPERRAHAESLATEILEENTLEHEQVSSRGLIIDRDKLLRETIQQQLLQENYPCHTVSSFNEALKIIMRDPLLDFLIVDSDLPQCLRNNLSLQQFVSSVREMRPDLLVIGHGSSETRKNISKCGISFYLEKPWEVEDFLTVINQSRRPNISSSPSFSSSRSTASKNYPYPNSLIEKTSSDNFTKLKNSIQDIAHELEHYFSDENLLEKGQKEQLSKMVRNLCDKFGK